MEKQKYSFIVGLGKTVKNSAYLLVPFFVALLAAVPMKYAWIAGPLTYLMKNYLENK